MLHAASKIKPRRTYYNEECTDASDFTNAFGKISKGFKSGISQNFYKKEQDIKELHKKYLHNLDSFGEKEIEAYSSMVDSLFMSQIKNGFAKKEN